MHSVENLHVQSILRRILERAGYAVTVVNDGRQAVDTVRRGERFDVIILDAMMPNVGGREAYEQIRQLATYLRSLEAAAPSVPDWRNGSG